LGLAANHRLQGLPYMGRPSLWCAEPSTGTHPDHDPVFE
jgi:hypothetical protein